MTAADPTALELSKLRFQEAGEAEAKGDVRARLFPVSFSFPFLFLFPFSFSSLFGRLLPPSPDNEVSPSHFFTALSPQKS